MSKTNMSSDHVVEKVVFEQICGSDELLVAIINEENFKVNKIITVYDRVGSYILATDGAYYEMKSVLGRISSKHGRVSDIKTTEKPEFYLECSNCGGFLWRSTNYCVDYAIHITNPKPGEERPGEKAFECDNCNAVAYVRFGNMRTAPDVGGFSGKIILHSDKQVIKFVNKK